MNVIIPLEIKTGYLLGCNIAENEYDEWEDGGFDSLDTVNRHWQAICCASSGNLYACVYGGSIYKSADSGQTWSEVEGTAGKDWNGMCARGTTIYASVYNEYIYRDVGESGTFSMAETTPTIRKWGPMCVCTDNHVWCTDETSGVDTYKQAGGMDNFEKDEDVSYDGVAWGIICAPNADMYVLINRGLSSSYIYHREGTSGAFTHLTEGWTVLPQYKTGRGICADSQNNIYVATTNDRIWMRTAGTGNFAKLTWTPDDTAFRGLCVDGEDSIYACVYGASLLKCSGSTIYQTDDYCQVTSSDTLSEHKIYQSLTDNNIGNNPTTDTTHWVYVENTNRTKVFDGRISSQVESSTLTATYIFFPVYNGVNIPDIDDIDVDGISVLNIEAGAVTIVEMDYDDDVLGQCGFSWDNAAGTTEPAGWDQVGTPGDFTLVEEDISCAVRVTADAAGEGISYTANVVAETEYQLILVYKNNSGDVARYAVYDMTHSANIKATTDLADATDYSVLSYVFTTPAGCTSVKVSMLNKNSGDIVTWKFAALAPTIYKETITTGALNNTVTVSDLEKHRLAIYTVSATRTSPPHIGEIILGTQYDIGGRNPKYGISWGIKDWSTIEADTYGNYDIQPRETSKWMKGSIDIDDEDKDSISNFLTYYTHTFLMWLGSETNQCMMIYGFCDDWSFSQDEPDVAVLNFSITGLT